MMKNIREIREKIYKYNEKNLASIKNANNVNNRDSILFYALACNVQNEKDVSFVIIKQHDIFSAAIAQECKYPSDGVPRWTGNDYDNIRARAGKTNVIYDSFQVEGITYKELAKNLQGNRSTETEKLVCESLESLSGRNDLTFKHIGNHHQKGWRDIAIYKGDRRIALIEVKGASGRFC